LEIYDDPKKRAGILADGTGLGKAIQILGSILFVSYSLEMPFPGRKRHLQRVY
jgi:hypothetical protein